jgi:hypothetical protein
LLLVKLAHLGDLSRKFGKLDIEGRAWSPCPCDTISRRCEVLSMPFRYSSFIAFARRIKFEWMRRQSAFQCSRRLRWSRKEALTLGGKLRVLSPRWSASAHGQNRCRNERSFHQAFSRMAYLERGEIIPLLPIDDVLGYSVQASRKNRKLGLW